MPHTSAFPQAQPLPPTATPPYGHPFTWQPVAAPASLAPPSPASPVMSPPLPTSPTVCLQIAEDIAPKLSHPQLGLLHYVAFVMLTTAGAAYRPDSPQAAQMIAPLVHQQLLLASQGGYVLSNLGHAVTAVVETGAIR